MTTINSINVEVVFDKAKAINSIKEFKSEIQKAIEECESLETSTQDVTAAQEEFSDTVGKAVKTQNEFVNSLENTTSQIESTRDEVKKTNTETMNMGGAADIARDGFGKLNGVLGAFGVSVGIAEIINQVNELADSAKTAYDNIQKIQQETSYKYALTETQQSIIEGMGYTTANQYAISPETTKDIYGALMNVFPELEQDTKQLEKMAGVFASISAIEGMENMSNFISNFFTLTKKYGMTNYDDMIQFLTTLEAVSQKTKGTGTSAETLLQTTVSSDKAASYMGLNGPNDVLYYLGSSALQGEGPEAQEFMSSIEDFVLKSWKTKLDELASEGVDTTGINEEHMRLWWSSILKDLPETEGEMFTYLSQQGFKAADAATIAKGILASGGDEDFRNVIETVITEVYKGSLSNYRESTLTNTDYQKQSEAAKEVSNAALADSGGLFSWLSDLDRRNAAKDTAWSYAKQIIGMDYDTAMNFAGKIYEADTKAGEEYYQKMKEVTDSMINYLNTNKYEININIKPDESFKNANIQAKVSTGKARSLG